MSVLQNLSQGSLLSDETLLHARDGYAPIAANATPEAAFEQWTRRLKTQHELAVAREMAGLPEESLKELAAVFARAPRRQRTDRVRHAFPAGGALVLAGACLLALASSLQAADAVPALLAQNFGVAALACGLVAICIGVIAGFSMMPLDVAHGRLGLCTGVLDEQHPWLYKASIVVRDKAADAYRQRVLTERGGLRGVDYLMMREIARANDALEATRVARQVAEQLLQVDAAAVEPQAREPRLASVPSAGVRRDERRRLAADAAGETVRAFDAVPSDRRRPG